jgi:polyisoprenoid-binding protein YceI
MAWQIDPVHSEVSFAVRHMMISTVRGRFEKFSGAVSFDESNPAATTVDVQIEVASVNTKEGQRDGHLRSPDFFDAANYPTISFKGTRVEVKDKTHARLYGNLTIRDVTKPAALEVEYSGLAKSPWGTTSAGFSAQTKINRKDWNLTWNQALETGGVLVGDEVTILIELEIVKVPEQAAQGAAVAA